MSTETARSFRSAACGDCYEWVFPALVDHDPVEAQAIASAALMVHMFTSHADLVHERTGLKPELIAASLAAGDDMRRLGFDPDLGDVKASDMDLIGRAWAAGPGDVQSDCIASLSPAGKVALKELMVAGAAWGRRQQEAADGPAADVAEDPE